MTSCEPLDLTPADTPIWAFARAGLRALLQFYATNDDGSIGAAIDLTDWSNFRLVGFDPANPATQLFELTDALDDGLVASGNEITVTIAMADIEAFYMLWQRAQYYLVGDDPTGFTQALCGGPFNLTLNPLAQIGQGSC